MLRTRKHKKITNESNSKYGTKLVGAQKLEGCELSSLESLRYVIGTARG